MSERVVHSCDVCGRDCDKADVRRFYSMGQGQFCDVGPCCMNEPIQRLSALFATRFGNSK